MTVGALTNANKYEDRDLDNVKANEQVSTKTALNTLANKAGMSDDYAVHGHDETAPELVAEHQERAQERWIKTFVEAVPGGEELATAYELHKELKEGKLGEAIKTGDWHVAEHAAKEFLVKMAEGAGLHGAKLAVEIPWILGKLAKAMAESVSDDAELGQEKKAAFVKSGMHVLVLGSLNGLPQEYVNAQRAHYMADRDSGSIADKLGTALGKNGNNALMGIMQLHCDQGIGAARTMFDAKQTPEEFFRAHPDLGKRFADDAAFHAGFEGAMYAQRHGQYDEMMKALDQRDVRYEAHHIAVRG
jgi:hypothetical protein